MVGGALLAHICSRNYHLLPTTLSPLSRGQRIADAIERSVSGPIWHGPPLADLLDDVTVDAALAKPVAGAHSIWELVLHMTAWVEIVRRRLISGQPFDPTPEQDWPPVPGRDAEAWRTAVERLKDAHRELAADVTTLDDGRLVSRVPGRDHTVLVELHGIVEHDAYHGGQVAVLKKALG